MDIKKQILVYDKQGAYGRILKGDLLDQNFNVYLSKKISDILKFIMSSHKRLPLIFVFADERELIDLLEIVHLDINVLYAPTNFKIYGKIKNFSTIQSIDLTQNKRNMLLSFNKFIYSIKSD